MLKRTSPYGTPHGFTSRSQHINWLANQPRVLPLAPPRKRRGLTHWVCVLLTILLAPLLLLAFLLVGERPAPKPTGGVGTATWSASDE